MTRREPLVPGPTVVASVQIAIARRKLWLSPRSFPDWCTVMINLAGFSKSVRTLAFPLHTAVPLLIPLLLAGCYGTTCFVGVINPPNNSLTITTGNNPSTCVVPQVQSTVEVVAQLAPACEGCSSSRQISRVHLLLTGIQLHPSAVADENSPEWEEMAPNLAQEPLRIELKENSAAESLISSARVSGMIPAGTYYQVRLRLADPSSTANTPLLGNNPCGSSGGSCVFAADGTSHPLHTLDGPVYLRIAVASPLEVHAGQENILHLELSPEWLLQNSSTGAVEVAPLLHGRMFK